MAILSLVRISHFCAMLPRRIIVLPAQELARRPSEVVHASSGCRSTAFAHERRNAVRPRDPLLLLGGASRMRPQGESVTPSGPSFKPLLRKPRPNVLRVIDSQVHH
jgi:hypothetical protein